VSGDAQPRWAVIGTGTISHHVIEDLNREGAPISVIFSRDGKKARRFAEQYGVTRATDDYASVLADPEVDLVYIATPFTTHTALARAAIRAGKHVLIEKPMAMNAAEAAALFAEAATAGVFLMEAMWTKFTPGFNALKSRLTSGTLGEPRSLRASFGFPMPRNTSKWELTGSPGALLDQGIYPVTLAHVLFGEPVAIHAAGTVREDGLDVSEHFTLEHTHGRFTHGAASMAEFLDPTATIAGTRGWIRITGMFWTMGEMEIHAGEQHTIFVQPEVMTLPPDGNGYGPMLSAVSDAIRQGLTQHPIHSAEDTVAVFRTLDSIRTELTPRPETHRLSSS